MATSWIARTLIARTLIARTLMKTGPLIKTPPNAPIGPRSPRLADREMLTLWQRTIHGQLEKHGFLLIGLHKRAACFLVVRIGGDHTFRILDVLVDAAKIVGILRLHGWRLLGYFQQQVVVVQAGNRQIGNHSDGRDVAGQLGRERMLANI